MMERAIRVRVTIPEDHTVRLPDAVPTGEAELIVLIPGDHETVRATRAAARAAMFGRLRGRATIADDFDAPLPDDVIRDFEATSEP